MNDIDHAIELANSYAPEHLCLSVENAVGLCARRCATAGGLFLGEASPEALGDYTAGPEPHDAHGRQRPLERPAGVHDFLKSMAMVNLPETELDELARAAEVIARAEGLTGHAHAAQRRVAR